MRRKAQYQFRAIGWIALLGSLSAAPTRADPTNGPVVVINVESSKIFLEAAEPGAVARACAADSATLQMYFRANEIPWSDELVRSWQGYAACHVLYRPALQGFRASPDNLRIQGLHIGVDPMAFLVGRKPIGGTLEIAKAVLAEMPSPVDVTVTVRGDFPQELWPDAVERHFPKTPHRIKVRASRVSATQEWAQDYLKSGEVGGKSVLITPRRLFEGRAEEGERYRPLLEGLRQDGMAASLLSWDGGDLQFVRSPNDPGRTILAHGGSSIRYWGDNLDSAEHSYLLLRELGADVALDLSAIGPHADYLVAFLPLDNIAIVSAPVHSDARLLEASAQSLLELLGSKRAPELSAMVDFLATWDRNLEGGRAALLQMFRAVEAEALALEAPTDARTLDDLTAYSERTCPGEIDACITDASGPELFAADPDLMRRVADAAAEVRTYTYVASALLGLMEAQLIDPPVKKIRLLDQASADLRKAGFQVVRAPYLVAPAAKSRWPGVSYVNLLAAERTLFVPSFGLGAYETGVFNRLKKKLGGKYRIVPVDARAALTGNGGVHCAFGIVRAPVRESAGS